MIDDAADGSEPRGERSAQWTDEESERSFDVIGDRLIEVIRRYLRLQQRLRGQAALYTIGDRELSLLQVDALEEVVSTGGLRMNELAARLGVDPSTATRTTAPLVDLGLLTRQTDPGNRRYVILRCTEQGASTAAWFAERRRSLMRYILEPMEPARRILLTDLMEEYLALSDRQGTWEMGEHPE